MNRRHLLIGAAGAAGLTLLPKAAEAKPLSLHLEVPVFPGEQLDMIEHTEYLMGPFRPDDCTARVTVSYVGPIVDRAATMEPKVASAIQAGIVRANEHLFIRIFDGQSRLWGAPHGLDAAFDVGPASKYTRHSITGAMILWSLRVERAFGRPIRPFGEWYDMRDQIRRFEITTVPPT